MSAEVDKACEAAGPAVHGKNYQEKGKFTVIETTDDAKEQDNLFSKLPIYETYPAKQDPKGVIIFIYDIFGWNERTRNIFEFADELAERTHCRIIMPDFYRGNPWGLDRFPVKTDEMKKAYGVWWEGVASFKVVKADIYQKILPLESVKNQKVGIMGACWGGLEGILLGDDKERFKCVGVIHPAKIDPNKMQNVQVPLYYGACINDFPANLAEEAMKKGPHKNIAKKSMFHQFEKMQHGFCAARGDWTQKEIYHQVQNVLEHMSKFFKKHLH